MEQTDCAETLAHKSQTA